MTYSPPIDVELAVYDIECGALQIGGLARRGMRTEDVIRALDNLSSLCSKSAERLRRLSEPED